MKSRHWHKELFKHSALFCILGYLSACATVAQDPLHPTAEDKAKYQHMTTLDAINKVEGILINSRQRELNVFAPEHYELADSTLTEAKKLIATNQPKEKIIHKFAIAEAVLKNGDRVMSKVKTILKDEINAKNKLKNLNAQKIYGTEYGNLAERLNQIIRNIENGKLEQADESRLAFAKSLNELQIKTIIHNAMNEPAELLKRIQYRGGSTLAPITFAETKAVYEKSEEFIRNNVFNEKIVAEVKKQALFAAKRALYITEEVASLSHRMTISVEQVVLDQEYRMTRIARALKQNDFRDNSIEVQSELLASSVKELNMQLLKQDDLIIALRDTLINVRDTNDPLTELNQQYAHLQQEKKSWLAKDALYQAKVEQLSAQLSKKEKSLSRLITHVESLEDTQSSDLTVIRNTLAEKEKALVDKNNTIATLQTKHLTQITNKDKDIEQLQALVSIISEDMSHQSVSLNSAHTSQISEKDVVLEKLKQEIIDQKSTLQNSGRSLVALREKHKKLIASKEQDIENLNHEIETYKKQRKIIASLKEKIRILRKSQDNSINAKIATSNKIIEKKDDDIAKLKQRILLQQEKQTTLVSEKNKLAEQIKIKQRKIEQQQQDIASIQQQTNQKRQSIRHESIANVE